MRALILDPHPLYAAGLRDVLDELEPGHDTVEASDPADVARLINETTPRDLILLNPSVLEGDSGALRGSFRRLSRSGRLVLLSETAEQPPWPGVPWSHHLSEDGVSGVLPKTARAAIARHILGLILSGGRFAIPAAIPGTMPAGHGVSDALPAPFVSPHDVPPAGRLAALTPRQIAVLTLIGEGCANRDIAEALDITEGTVKIHVGAILKILGVRNRTQAALAFDALRHVHPDAAAPAEDRIPQRREAASGR